MITGWFEVRSERVQEIVTGNVLEEYYDYDFYAKYYKT